MTSGGNKALFISTIAIHRSGLRQCILALPAVLLIISALSGCGWQLRTEASLANLEAVSLSGASADMRHALIEKLRHHRVLILEVAPLSLQLDREHWTQRTVAVDARGRRAATELRLSISWRLLDEKARPLNSRQTIEIIRTFNYDPANATAAADEEVLTREIMYDEAAAYLLRQLDARHQQFLEET